MSRLACREPCIYRTGQEQSAPTVLLYQDSYVNETYLEGHLNPWSSLNLVHKLRLRLNWQQGGGLPGGTSQRARRLDYWTLVSRADYTWQLGPPPGPTPVQVHAPASGRPERRPPARRRATHRS